jgi:hypothetical protein
MNKALTFIKKSNQVLFFLAALIFIVMITSEITSKVFRSNYEPPKIELVDSSDIKNDVKKPVYTIGFLTRLDDVHIFELSSKVIDTSQYHDSNLVEMFSGAKVSHDLSFGHYLSDNAVNLMFVKENGTRKMLLKSDGLVKEFSKAKFKTQDDSFGLDKNLYLIINEDTNKNGYLDHRDEAKLFSSTYDGKDLTLILSNVGSFDLINDNKLIISQKGDSPSFFTFNVADSTLHKLNTAINVSTE